MSPQEIIDTYMDDLTLDEAKAILARLYLFTDHMTCTRDYDKEDICDMGCDIRLIIERET